MLTGEIYCPIQMSRNVKQMLNSCLPIRPLVIDSSPGSTIESNNSDSDDLFYSTFDDEFDFDSCFESIHVISTIFVTKLIYFYLTFPYCDYDRLHKSNKAM